MDEQSTTPGKRKRAAPPPAATETSAKLPTVDADSAQKGARGRAKPISSSGGPTQPGPSDSLQARKEGKLRYQANRSDTNFKILDKKDQLVYRVSSLVDKTAVQLKAVEKKFVTTFAEVSRGMPEYDRQRILSHWRSRPERASDNVPNEPLPRPLFEIVEVGPWDASYQIRKSITDPFSFPVSLIVEHECRLRFEIARVLAQELRLATRAHWQLINTMLTDPLERWERCHEQFTEEEYDNIQDELEAQYLPIVEQEIGAILSRWQIEELIERGESK